MYVKQRNSVLFPLPLRELDCEIQLTEVSGGTDKEPCGNENQFANQANTPKTMCPIHQHFKIVFNGLNIKEKHLCAVHLFTNTSRKFQII